MKPPVLAPRVLDGLRNVGDPAWRPRKKTAKAMVKGSQPGYQPNPAGASANFKKGSVEAVAMAEADAYLLHVRTVYGASPGRMIERARELFVRYGDEIGAALLLSALPESYAAEWGAPVLIAHGDLVWQLPRRIRQTALFLIGVLTDTGPDVVTSEWRRAHPKRAAKAKSTAHRGGPPVINPASTLFQQCVWLRRFHGEIRRHLDGFAPRVWTAPSAPKSVPLNQEDLLATLLTFSVTTFRVLEEFGIALEPEDQDAYLFLWNLVGACLGVGTPTVGKELRKRAQRKGKRTRMPLRDIPRDWFLPDTVGKAERLLDQLQARQWIAVQTTLDAGRPFPWTDLVPGRTLVTALLDGLVDAMPPSRQAWPAIVMRELVPTPVQSRLGLQRMGLVGLAGHALDGVRGGEQLRGASLRFMANDVTRHAMQRFLQADAPSAFRIPGLDLSQLTAAGRGSPYELTSRRR